MLTYTSNIELQPNHTYFHEDIGNVKSVTTLLKGGNPTKVETAAITQGNTIHKIIELFLKGQKQPARNLYNSLEPHSQAKVKALIGALKEINLKNSASELSFVTQDQDIKYGGTVDLLTLDKAIDFKTGDLKPNHILQAATYSIANCKKEALILSFKGNKLEKTFLNLQEIENGYKEFTNKAKHALNIIDPFANEILVDLNTYNNLKSSIEDLNKKLKQQKELIEKKLNKEGFNSFKVNNFSCFNQKGKTTTTLTKEAKELLLQSNPNYFKTTTSAPSFVIKGA